MDTVPGWVQNNHIGLIMEVGHLDHHIAGDKMTIVEAVLGGIGFGGFDRFGDQL